MTYRCPHPVPKHRDIPWSPFILLDLSDYEIESSKMLKKGGQVLPEDETAMYLIQLTVAYDGTEYQLGFQFWIAMFDNPFQGWLVWRKFDAPELNIAAGSQLPVPLRYTYPVNEQNLNNAQYEAASSAIGMDEQQAPTFLGC